MIILGLLLTIFLTSFGVIYEIIYGILLLIFVIWGIWTLVGYCVYVIATPFKILHIEDEVLHETDLQFMFSCITDGYIYYYIRRVCQTIIKYIKEKIEINKINKRYNKKGYIQI